MNKKDLSMSMEEFGALLDSYKSQPKEGFLTKATIINIDKNMVILDVGLKTEAYIARREFGADDIKTGDIVDVFVERYEGPNGYVVASRDKARREETWSKLEEKIAENQLIEGIVTERIRGGFIVDLYGVLAFMPGSQADVKPLHNQDELVGKKMPFKVLKMDYQRSNVIVSHRAVLEETMVERRKEIMKSINVGDVVEGTIKNITDYGVFIDLGGIDGLLHVIDLSWKRVNHPKELLSVGQTINVKIIGYDEETQRISLGLKQLTEDPYKDLIKSIKIGDIMEGKVTSVADYGVFVEVMSGIEGLVHVSEISWTKKNLAPHKVVSVGDLIKVKVLEADEDKRRLSFGIKQTQPNPWNEYASSHKAGDEIEGEIKNITEFGIFIALGNDLDGMVHIGDLDWDKNGAEAIKGYKVGETVKAKILEVNPEKERISLGIKQLATDRVEDAISSIKKNDVVTCIVTEITEDILIVDLNGMRGEIAKSDLSRERADQNMSRFTLGTKVDAKVISVSKKEAVIKLSIKALEIEEEKKMVKEYGSTDSGSQLADMLSSAIAKKKS